MIASKPSRWQSVVLMMINPAQVLTRRMAGVTWPFALLVSGAAFGLFFLQTGLDRGRAAHGDLLQALTLAGVGAVYGTLGVASIGFLAWMLSKIIGGSQPPGWVIRAIALSYGSALVYAVCGLAFSVTLHWNTAVTFGVTGVLWAMGPMTAVFREVSGGKTFGSILLTTICGSLVLLGWGVLATGR